MQVRHPTALLIVAILLGATLLGAGIVAGTFVVADASADEATNRDDEGEFWSHATTGDDDSRHDATTITVDGTGSVAAQPDQAVVVLAASARAENASDATSSLAGDVADLRTALRDEGIPNQSVRTIDFQVGQERRGNETVFVARQTFRVTLNETSAVGSTIDAAVGNGASEVFAVEFTLSENRTRELRETAIDRALDDARDQGDVVAASTNLTVSSVKSVSVGSVGDIGQSVETAAADGGTDIDVGPVTVTARVQVTYNATSA